MITPHPFPPPAGRPDKGHPMIQLNPSECRVLGVLVEKAHTSSAYPLSLNAATTPARPWAWPNTNCSC